MDTRTSAEGAAADSVVVAPVPARDLAAAAALAARAMHDNPMHVAALGPNARRRVEVMRRAFEAMLSVDGRETVGAWLDGRLVGVAAHVPSAHCQPGPREVLRLGPTVARAGVRTPRLLTWLAAWGRRDPDHPHSHLGPVAVEAGLRGRGTGSTLLAHYTRLVDGKGTAAYLETDRLANVRLYRRHGFAVVHEATVLGVPNWFMVRPPGADGEEYP